MKRAFEVRAATRADLPTIMDFQLSMARETEGLDLDVDKVTAGVEGPFADPSLARYYVASSSSSSAVAGSPSDCGGLTSPTNDDHVVAGMLMVTFEWDEEHDGLFYWIQSVYTRPAYRGVGVFKQLYAFVASEVGNNADALGIKLYAHHDNERAVRTYERLGLRVYEGAQMWKWMKGRY